jgi:D-alanyl-D-alanine dipeptidase
LTKLQTLVDKAGGSVEIKSAYRPPAYQAHLQEVWDKWNDLRDNEQPQCQDLKAQVLQEFSRHHLLVTQRPANQSDHTRGLAFDALVLLPQGPRLRRRKITLDALARMSGVRRVDIRHDPVHFKFIGFWSRRG